MIGVHFLTAIYGQQIWQTELIGYIQIRHLLFAGAVLSVIQVIAINVGYVFGKKTPLDDFANIPRKQDSHIWNPLFPIMALLMLTLKSYLSGMFVVNPTIFVLTFGFAYAKLTTKLIMTNVSYGDMDLWDSCLVAPLLLCANTFLWLLPHHTALLCTLVYSVMDFARYFTYSSWDLRDTLDLWIFSLKYPLGHPHCRNGNLGYYINGINNAEIKAFAYKKQHTVGSSNGYCSGKLSLSSQN